MSKTPSEKSTINQKLGANDRVINACDDSVLLINNILNSIKLLKKSLRKVYPDVPSTKELNDTMIFIAGDIISIKKELEEVASDTADESNKLTMRLKELENEDFPEYGQIKPSEDLGLLD